MNTPENKGKELPCPQFPQRFRALAAAQNKSINFLVDALECSRPTVINLRTGARTPSLELFVRIARVLEVSLDELAGFHCSSDKGSAAQLPPELPLWLIKLLPDLISLDREGQRTLRSVLKALTAARKPPAP
jgi:transcriptional regulator with XRE-family HTH domain